MIKKNYQCSSCNANWAEHEYSNNCMECGGGAMESSCIICRGRCDSVWKRAVIDSWDTKEAHWIGSCSLSASGQLKQVIKKRSGTKFMMIKHQRPPVGKSVDKTQLIKIKILQDLPSPWVSVRLGDGRVFLSKCQLEEMAEDAALISKMWKKDSKQVTEEQRLCMIFGNRARDLLKVISDHSDESEYLFDKSKLPMEVDYLFSKLLEDGAAAVVSLATGHSIPAIKVHYTGFSAGPTIGSGKISFFFDTDSDRGSLLMVDWWVS